MRSESRATSTFYRRRGKRLLDLVFAVPALAVAMPVIALVSLGVAAALGRPVIFAQERPGLGGRTFRFHKFRGRSSGTVRESSSRMPSGSPRSAACCARRVSMSCRSSGTWCAVTTSRP